MVIGGLVLVAMLVLVLLGVCIGGGSCLKH